MCFYLKPTGYAPFIFERRSMFHRFKNNAVLIVLFILSISLSGCSKAEYIEVKDAEDISEETSFSGGVSGDGVSEAFTSEVFTTEATVAEGSAEFPVYVCGAVNCPGVYYFRKGDIGMDGVEAAGGMTDDAASNHINLAKSLSEGEKLYIPFEYEVGSGAFDKEDGLVATGETDDRVNINTADLNELMSLPGIGENKAKLIIEYRELHGPYNCVEDIMNINGIKGGIYSNIRDKITVN